MFKENYDEAVDLLKTLIRIPSISRDEELAANALQLFIEATGCVTSRHGNNVWCVGPHFDAQRPTLLLNSHIDTVKPALGWRREPFTPIAEGDRLYGLGSNDAGASLVSLFEAFKIMSGRRRSYNLVYLASCEEEVSGAGGVESVLPKLPRIDCAIVGEPTMMQPAVAEKGLMVLDVTATGKSGHAARNEGVNAIYLAIDDIEKIRRFDFERTSPLLGAVKCTVTIVNAGTQHNVVPDKCTFTVDVRSNELYTNQELAALIAAELKSEVKPRSLRLNSSSIAGDHPLVRRAVEMGKEPFGSPTLSDQALMRFPTLKMGPGDSARSHTADEFVELSEIARGIEEYVSLLDGLELR